MMFLVPTTMVCEHCDGCVTTEIRNVTTRPQIGHESDRMCSRGGEGVQNG
jgi:hypothetical protein